MPDSKHFKTAGLLPVVAALAFAIVMNGSRTVRASQDEPGDQNEGSLIRRGFDMRHTEPNTLPSTFTARGISSTWVPPKPRTKPERAALPA